MQGIDISELVRQTMMVLILIIVAAKLGGELMGRLGQPPVLGELLMGVILGNLSLFGITLLDPLKNSSLLRVLAEIGAILLLFEVGVESDLVSTAGGRLVFSVGGDPGSDRAHGARLHRFDSTDSRRGLAEPLVRRRYIDGDQRRNHRARA